MEPNKYYLARTDYVPNSKFPALIYPRAFSGKSADDVRASVENNGWLYDDVWGHYPRSHFHPNTHECYIVSKGRSTLVLGRSPLDDREGVEIEAGPGDVVVLPAGVSHAWINSSEDLEYMSYYPRGAPKYETQFARKQLDEIPEKVTLAESIPVPSSDPVNGRDGGLCQIWSTVDTEASLENR